MIINEAHKAKIRAPSVIALPYCIKRAMASMSPAIAAVATAIPAKAFQGSQRIS